MSSIVAPGAELILMKVMLSGRFDGKEKEAFLRLVGASLKARGVNVLLVTAGATGDFGPMTIKCLAEMDVMVAFCYEDYGEKTGSSFCSYYEVEWVTQQRTPCIALKLYDGAWPPAPVHWDWKNDRPGEPDKAGTDQNKFYFSPSKVNLEPDPIDPEACANMLLAELKKLERCELAGKKNISGAGNNDGVVSFAEFASWCVLSRT